MPNTNLLLQFIYRLVQFTAWLTTRLYFRRVVVLNAQNLNAEGPLIVICNHPNTLMDPLMAIQQTQERPFLLANYSLFKHPIPRVIFSTLFCIPIQRSKDIPAGQTPKNDEAFRRSIDHLYAGGSVFLAPESLSENGRQLRPFKSGISRIVLTALSDWKTDAPPLRILPVGLIYFNHKKPNTDVVINVGEPFDIKKETGNLPEHYKRAVDELTIIIENKMRPLVIDCADTDEDNFLKKVENILQNDNPVSTKEKFLRSKKFLEKISEKKFEINISREKNNVENIFSFKINLENYFSQLDVLHLRDTNVKKFPVLKFIFILGSGLPIFALGFINNIIPMSLATFTKNRMNLEDYETTIQYVAGLVFFPVAWWMQSIIFSRFFYNPHLVLIYWLIAISTGLFARYYYVCFLKTRNYFNYKNADEKNNLSEIRQSISNTLAG